MTEKPYEYIGDYSAAPPWHSRLIHCHDCMISFTGCWDNFQCPKCGKGETPSSDINLNEECPF